MARARSAVRRLSADATSDHQIGGDHTPAKGVSAVSRDWFVGSPLRTPGSCSTCYVDAHQTRADIAFAQLITQHAHAKDLAVAQKNTPQPGRTASLKTVGSDLAVTGGDPLGWVHRLTATRRVSSCGLIPVGLLGS